MNNKQFQIKNAILALAMGAVLGTAPALASAATEATWGGDIIIRPFYRNNARDFDSNTSDKKQFTTERARLKANIKVDENIGGVVELLHFRKWGAADPNRVVDANGVPNGSVCSAGPPITCFNPAMDDNWLDLNQAYIEVKNLFDTPLWMKAGRQEMAYGDQRLIGNTNFWSTYPFPRAYDAFKVGAKYETFDVDGWVAKVTERQFGTLFGSTATSAGTGGPGSDRTFAGIWATLKNIPDNTVDLYLLSMTDSGYNNGVLATYEGVTGLPPNFGHFPYAKNTAPVANYGGTGVYNVGARLKGKSNALDYSLELNQQFGEAADTGKINATGGAAVVGYTMPEAMGLRISGEYVFASGDDTPFSGDHKTFYQFTPSPHMHLGAQDFIAFQNINAWRIGASFNAKQNLKLSADFWNFQLDKQQDFWYGSNGITTRNAAGSLANGAEGLLATKKIGTEIDLVAKYEYSPPLSLELGYSAFNPGSGIKGTPGTAGVFAGTTPQLAGRTGSDRATFAWGMLMLKF